MHTPDIHRSDAPKSSTDDLPNVSTYLNYPEFSAEIRRWAEDIRAIVNPEMSTDEVEARLVSTMAALNWDI